MKIFAIKKIRGYDVDIKVRVYKNKRTLKTGIIHAGFKYQKGTRAQFSPYYYFEKNSRVKKNRAILFLCEGFLGMNVISHESVHVGLWILRVYKKNIQLSKKDITAAEEELAYMIGEVGKTIVSNLTGLGYYN